MKRCWRITPSPWLDTQVEALARRENRSTANMLFRLVSEALDARRVREERAPEVNRLATVIAGGSPS